MKHPIYLIVAMDEKRGIGKDGSLPWHLKKEMQYFAKITSKTQDPTKQNIVIMGRSTWESLPESYRPLPGRKNVVLTNNLDYQADGTTVVHSIEAALSQADAKIETIFIIGGAKVFAEMLEDPLLSGVYLTRIHAVYDCDTFLPPIKNFPGESLLGSDQEKEVKFTYTLLHH